MRTEIFAIKNHKIICYIECLPRTEELLQHFCNKKGFDTWVEVDEEAALILLGFQPERKEAKNDKL